MNDRHPDSIIPAPTTEQASPGTHEQTLDHIPIDAIRIDGGTQSRAELSQATIDEYKEQILAGATFPPVVAYFDGVTFWLADGFHRFHAHRDAEATSIIGDIRIGTLRDAKLFSFGANDTHGLRRSNADKRKAVTAMLSDSEWETWSQARIAKQCRVSVGFVSKVVNELSIHGEQIRPSVRQVERNGVTYEQNTANIGKPAAPVAVAPSADNAPLQISPTSMHFAAPAPAFAASGEVTTPSDQAPPAEADEGAAPSKVIELSEDEYNELKAALAETLADNEKMGRIFDADDRLKAAMDEVKRQAAIAESAERSRDARAGEYSAMVKSVKHWQNEAAKEKKRADRAERELAALRGGQ